MHDPYRKILTETKLITCESPTTLDMRSRRIRHGNTQQRCLCASSFCIREVFIEALSSRNFQSRTEFRSHSFLAASRKTHRPNVSASAVNLLRQKRKKRTLAETLPSVLFVGHRQTVRTRIRGYILWRLIRVPTVCLQNVQFQF